MGAPEMLDARGYLELLSWFIVRRSEEIIRKHPQCGGRVLRMGFVGFWSIFASHPYIRKEL
jgi:hypothetical protein